jgi:hypothetical protein
MQNVQTQGETMRLPVELAAIAASRSTWPNAPHAERSQHGAPHACRP